MKTSEEAKSFSGIWHGGYFEGDPLKPLERSSYGIFGYASTLNLIYQACIKPYVNVDATVLEIGPGRGAFTKCFKNRKAQKIYAVDVLSAEHNKFWEYVGSSENISYHVVEDTDLSHVPDNSIDYFFSFGCLCHASNEVVEGYIVSLGKKMKSRSRGFLMIADYDKFNYCVSHPELFSLQRVLRTRRTTLEWIIISVLYRLFPYSKLNQSEDQDPNPGR